MIRFISANCVPVALNLYEIRKAKGPGGDFFRTVQKQRPAQYQGLYLVSPDGQRAGEPPGVQERTRPGRRRCSPTWSPGSRRSVTVKPREVERADPLPDRGVGV